RPARQPARRPARRRGRGDREAQGPPAVRPRDPDEERALRDRRPGHRPPGGHAVVVRGDDPPYPPAVPGDGHDGKTGHLLMPVPRDEGRLRSLPPRRVPTSGCPWEGGWAR